MISIPNSFLLYNPLISPHHSLYREIEFGNMLLNHVSVRDNLYLKINCARRSKRSLNTLLNHTLSLQSFIIQSLEDTISQKILCMYRHFNAPVFNLTTSSVLIDDPLLQCWKIPPELCPTSSHCHHPHTSP